jgi:hypothetical protein
MVCRICDIKTNLSIQSVPFTAGKVPQSSGTFPLSGKLSQERMFRRRAHGTVLTGTRATSCCSKTQGKRITQLYRSIRSLDQRSTEAEVTVSLLEALRLKHCVQTVTVVAWWLLCAHT